MISTSSAGVSTRPAVFLNSAILASNSVLADHLCPSMLCDSEVDNVQNVMGARVTRMPNGGLSTVIERWGVSAHLYVVR
ncbi:hypothetical protein FB451DRAFT_1300926 [Mycena latifolia]|nr:hypothetical protein FB451DRAFT_1300926 [Mycena latifolia]